jgi:predicted GNAT family acetyltransferase
MSNSQKLDGGFIEFTSRSTLFDPEYADDFYTSFTGEIWGIDEQDNEVEIGAIKGTIIEMTNIEKYQKSGELYELFDLTQEVSEYMSQIWDSKTKKYSLEVNPDYDVLYDTLIIDRIYIYPEFNGHGYGLSAIQRAIEHFRRDENSLIILQSHPLQLEKDMDVGGDKFNKHMDLNIFESNEAKAKKSLMNYYASGGFTRIKKTSYMFKLEVGNLEGLVNGRVEKTKLRRIQTTKKGEGI